MSADNFPTFDTVEVFSILREALQPRGLGGLTELKDFMSYEECLAVAEQHFADTHPGFEERHSQGKEIKHFAIQCAASVAWSCAAEATRRAKKISRPLPKPDKFSDLT